MTPTREQLTAAPLDAYSAEDRAFFAFWYAHMKNDLMQPPLHEVAHSVAKLIHTAGREQGLMEAAAKVRAILADCEARDVDDPELEQVAQDIEQLRSD